MNIEVITANGIAGDSIAALARSRLRLALSLTAIMIAIYFGFMTLFAFDKPLLGVILAPGLSLGLLLGPLVITCAFTLCRLPVPSHFAKP